jgi:hypothetical protein
MGPNIMRLMPFMQGWKPTKKFLVSILLVLAAVMAIMVVVLSIHQKGVLIAELNDKGKNTAEFLAGISAEPILNYNFLFLESYVRESHGTRISSMLSSGTCRETPSRACRKSRRR